jgi:hypothetical protein
VCETLLAYLHDPLRRLLSPLGKHLNDHYRVRIDPIDHAPGVFPVDSTELLGSAPVLMARVKVLPTQYVSGLP